MEHSLKVPGARLHYQRRGSGPTLLLISGGPADADVYAGLAAQLAPRYTVVTFDPRGNSRSPFDGAPDDWRADVHADDAASLIAAVAEQPAYVFGSSAGAEVGLALVARHPHKVRALVAHEPPLVALLPDAAVHHARAEEIVATYRRAGVAAAMPIFLAGAGLNGRGDRPEPPGPQAAEAMARLGRNLELFLAHGLQPIGRFVPDLAALRAAAVPITVAGGETSGPQPAYRAAVALAERLGTSLVAFPGDHGGFTTHARAFADRLDEVLARA